MSSRLQVQKKASGHSGTVPVASSGTMPASNKTNPCKTSQNGINPAQPEKIKALPISEELRALLYIEPADEIICARYADIVAYCAADSYTIDLTTDDEPEQPEFASLSNVDTPKIGIDIAAETPIGQTLDSFNVLPYITVASKFPQIQFFHMTMNHTQGHALFGFISQIIHGNTTAWEQYVLGSRCVEEVRIWWKKKSVDIVLKPGSRWALEWDCDIGVDEGVEATELKMNLGLNGKKKSEWNGAVVVGSVEG